jgi:hypothetical protein
VAQFGDVMAQLAKETRWTKLQRSSSGLDPAASLMVSWGAAVRMTVKMKMKS